MNSTDSALYTVDWAENPLESKVHLTAAGMLRLKLGIAIDAVSDVRACLQLAKDEQDFKWCDRDDVGEDVEGYIERRSRSCAQWLLESHCGDCTCVPMSCLKCIAEDMLGFSTTEGLGKHPGHNVQSAFGGGRATIAEAIAYLQGPIVPTWGTPEEWEPHMARWRQERDAAIAWLTAYRSTRLEILA